MPGRTPAELFLKRQIRTRFSLLKTELASRTEEKQAAQKRHHDRCGSSFRSFQEGDAVRIRSFRGGVEKWIQAKVLRRLGAVTYLIEEGQRQRTVHVDHMLPGQGNVETVSLSLSSPVAENVPPVPLDGALPVLPRTPTTLSPPADFTNPTEQVVEVSSSPVSSPPAKKHRYPERVRGPPKRLNL